MKTRLGFVLILVLASTATLASWGCSTIDSRVIEPNPLVVASGDFETIWRETIAVVDDYFDIEYENRLSRRIVTKPQVAATVVEPWRGDSVGFRQRVEASLQTIRRFAVVTINPATTGGYSVKVEVFKELEYVPQADPNALGGSPAVDDFDLVVDAETASNNTPRGKAPDAQWIPRGRDPWLENVLVGRINQAIGGLGQAQVQVN